MTKGEHRRQQRRHRDYERKMTAAGFRFRPVRPQPPKRHEPAPEQLNLVLDEFDARIAAALARMDALML